MKETNELVEAAKSQQKYGCNNLTASDIAKYNWLPSLEFPGCLQNGGYLLYSLLDINNTFKEVNSAFKGNELFLRCGFNEVRKDHYVIKYVQKETLKEEVLYIGKIDSVSAFKELLGEKFLDIQCFYDTEERIKELKHFDKMDLLYKMKYE